MMTRAGHLSVVRFLLSLALLVGASSAFAGAPFRTIVPGDLEGEYIVSLRGVKPEAVDAAAREIAARVDGRVVAVWTHAATGFWIRVPAERSQLLFRDARVASVEQNARVHASAVQDINITVPHPAGAFPPALMPNPLWNLGRISHRERNAPDFYNYAYSNSTATTPVVIAYFIDGGALRFHQEFEDDPFAPNPPGKSHPGRTPRMREVHGSNVIATDNGPDRLASTAPNPFCSAGSESLASMPTLPSWQFHPAAAPQLRWDAAHPWFTGGFDEGVAEHGIGVASVLGGRTVGVAKSAALVPVKALGCDSSRSSAYLILAANWILAEEKAYFTHNNKRRPAVVSISTYRDPAGRGHLNIPAENMDAFGQALQALTDYGIPVFSAANNGRRDACQNVPARFSRRGGRGSVITVGGLGKSPCSAGVRSVDHRWDIDFDCNAPEATPPPADEAGTNFGACVDILAPAEHTPVASSAGWSAYRNGSSGTSYSAPMVAGIAARLMAEDPKIWETLGNDGTQAEKDANKAVTTAVWQRIAKSATVVREPDTRHLGRGLPNLIAYVGAFPLKTQPESKDLLPGGSTMLSVTTPEGITPCGYQWYKGEYSSTTKVGESSSSLRVDMGTSNERKDYWVRAFRSVPSTTDCFQSPEYTDSAIATVSVGCVVILKQPHIVTDQMTGATSLAIGLDHRSPVTVTWYEGFPGDESQEFGRGPSVPFTAGAETKSYWARVQSNVDASCVVKSDLVQVWGCTALPPQPLNVRLDPAKPGEIFFDGAPGYAYLLFIVHADGSRERVGGVATVTATTGSFVADFVKTRKFVVRAQNECGRYSESVARELTPPCPVVSLAAPPELIPHADNRPSPSVAVFAKETVVATQPLLQKNYTWYAENAFGTPVVKRTLGTTRSVTDVPEDGDHNPKHTWYWNVVEWCPGPNDTKETEKAFAMIRPQFTKQPADSSIASNLTGELFAEAKDVDVSNFPVTYQWYIAKAYDDSSANDEQSPIAGATLKNYVPAKAGRYFVRAKIEYFSAGKQHTATADSRVATVSCVGRRRSVRSSSEGEPAAPSEATELTVENDGDGSTVNWYQATSIEDTSNLVGTGYTIWVAPSKTTSYFAEVTSPCGAKTKTDLITITVDNAPFITVQPAPATTIIDPATNIATATVSVTAGGIGNTYQWRRADTGAALPNGTNASYIWTVNVLPANVAAQLDVYVDVTASGKTTRSTTVRLTAIRTGTPQKVVDWYHLARPYNAAVPITLYATMDPAPSGANSYAYEWFKDNGTSAGTKLSSTNPTMQVTTGAIDTYWARITGTHTVTYNGASVSYTEQTVSPKMYVSLYGLCQLPRLQVTQDKVEVSSNELVTFTALVDWPGVTYQWYKGQTGDTRDTFGANAGKPHELTVNANVSWPYWVRATSDCGGYVDSPTLTYVANNCSPVLINQNVASSTVAYNGSAALHVDPVGFPNPKYTWYYVDSQLATKAVVADSDYNPGSVTESRRYWVTVRNMACYNSADSFIATVRVASAPGITPPAWPAEVWVDANASTRLNALSTGGLSYKWYRGEVGDYSDPIAGATLAYYDTPTPATSDQKYWVRVTGSAGIVDSSTIHVRICTPPSLPAGTSYARNIESGQTAMFQVDPSGTDVQLQWYEGAVNDTTKPIGRPVNLLQVSPTQTTKYWLRLTSLCGVNGSAPRVLNAGPFTASVCPVVQTATAADASVMSGGTTTLSVSSTGNLLEYQWYKKVGTVTTAITGATAASITSPAITADTTFWCTVKSGTCTRTSASVTVTLCTQPTINWVTSGKNVRKGDLVTFSVSATSSPLITYYSGPAGNVAGSTVVAGPTNATSVTLPVTQTASYWARAVAGKCHDDTTAITISVCIPTITQPAGGSITAGASKTLSVTSDITSTYQWYQGLKGDTSIPVPNGTGALVTVTPPSDTNYWVRVTGCNGQRTDSNAALVTVCQPAGIPAGGQPQPWSIQRGAPVTLSVTANGSSLKYQWYKGTSGTTTTPIPSATNSWYTTSPTIPTAYWVKVYNDCSSVNSNTVQVDVCTTPVISTQPQSQTIPSGGTASLSVDATQETGLAMSYRWYSRAAGASSWTWISAWTGPAHSATGVQTATEYYVEIVSGSCRITSDIATVSLCAYSDPVASPSDKSVAYQQMVTLSMPSLTPAPDSYRWYRGVAGDRSYPVGSSYWLTIYPTATTQYWCEVTSGNCVSKTRTITVNVCKPTITAQPQSKTIFYGQSTTLSVTATAATGYQWYTGTSSGYGTAIPGATSSSHAVQPGATTSYWVKVTGGCSTVNSALATVTVD